MVSHQSDLLTQDLILSGTYKYCKFTEYGISFDFPYMKYEHETGNISYPVWQIEELRENDLSDGNLEKLIDFLETEFKDYGKFLDNFKKQIKSGENKVDKINEYFEKSLKSVSTVPYFAFELGLNKRLEMAHISPKDIPSSLTDTSLASLEVKRIYSLYITELEAKKASSSVLQVSKELKKDLKKFCDRFGYLGMIYFKGNPWTIQEAYRMLFSSGREEIKENKDKSELVPIVKIVSKLLKLRTQKWEMMCYGTYLFRKYIKQYFADEIIYEDLLDLRIEEVLDIINDRYPMTDIGQGRKYFILETTPTGVAMSVTQRIPKKNNVNENSKTAETIKGMVAQSGKVVGKVKIVLTPKDGYKVSGGDILVTKMSTPDFLPIMQKAAAFITDIGGITSHAAIVSREMHKPCIIGTKNATEILKDGMTVEVDADKGIVKIL